MLVLFRKDRFRIEFFILPFLQFPEIGNQGFLAAGQGDSGDAAEGGKPIGEITGEALREIGWDLVRSHDTSVVAEGPPRMHGHLPRIFRNHRIVVAPNIRGVTVPGVKTASSRRKSWKGK
jgi:hypothetical protein